MVPDKYKYHVAISFLKEDDEIAQEIHNLIADRFQTFVYFENYAEVEGTDGVETFAEVFGGQALLNVILYREGWGKTKYTGLEANAIKSRAMDDADGWDHLLVVKLDKSPLPKWIPSQRIYSDYGRRGALGVATVIEHRIEELGGEARGETLQDFAARKKREKELDEEIRSYLESVQALKDATAEVSRMFDIAFRQWNAISDVGLKEIRKEKRYVRTSFDYYRLVITWDGATSNSLTGWNLAARIEQYLPYSESHYRTIDETRYAFDMNRVREVGWSSTGSKQQFLRSQTLIDFWTKHLLQLPPVDPNDLVPY